MTLQNIIDYCNSIANKEQSGAAPTPDQWQSYFEAANIDYFNLKAGLPQEYKPGHALPRQAWETTQRITDDLRPFKVIYGGEDTAALPIDTHGQMAIPSDYWVVSSVRYRKATVSGCETTIVWRPIEILKDGDLNDRLGSTLKAPDYDYPVCCFFNSYIQFYPKNLQYVTFTYLRRPVTPLYAYTIVNDVPVYDAVNSIQFEYPDNDHLDICRIILGYMGINVREQQLLQYAELMKAKGE